MRKHVSKKVILFSSLSMTVIISATFGFYMYQNHMSQNIFPANIMSSVSFSLFYPTSLPPGFLLNKQSVQQTNGQVVTYSASDNSGHNVVFSIQQRPATFDFDSFYSKSLSNTQRFTTANGEAAIGSATLTGKVGSLVSGNAWVLITSNQNDLSNETLQNVLKGLVPAH